MLCEECNSFIGFNEAIYWSILRGIKAGTILEKEGGGARSYKSLFFWASSIMTAI